MTPNLPPPTGMPDLVSATGGHVTITSRDGVDAYTICTCGGRHTNPANCANWAHADHTRSHAS